MNKVATNNKFFKKKLKNVIQCCGSGPGIRCLFDPLDPESRIQNGFFRIPDLGSTTHILKNLDNIFSKNYYNSWLKFLSVPVQK
jgi:hypothetical protein